jgi:tRNA pseudouridine55 synthase
MLSGIINLDKPAGISSARAVAAVKRLLQRGTRIGHAGTLDPFATGVLLLLVGKATRQCESLMSQPKQYLATIRLGATTATDDPESPQTLYPSPPDVIVPPARDTVVAAVTGFIGAIQQRPPAYSAMKVQGRRAYDLARGGHPPVLEPRTVQVSAIEILSYDWPLLSLRIDCGRGTYVRAIARDLGQALGVGGYLTELRRTAIGAYRVEGAVSLDQLAMEGPTGLTQRLAVTAP